MEKRKKTSHHRFLWRCLWKATKMEKFHWKYVWGKQKFFASEKIIMKGKKILFISETHQQREFYESLLTPLWYSQLSAFPSRCSPAVVYWWLHFSLFFSFYDSFRIFFTVHDFSHLLRSSVPVVIRSRLQVFQRERLRLVPILLMLVRRRRCIATKACSGIIKHENSPLLRCAWEGEKYLHTVVQSLTSIRSSWTRRGFVSQKSCCCECFLFWLMKVWTKWKIKNYQKQNEKISIEWNNCPANCLNSSDIPIRGIEENHKSCWCNFHSLITWTRLRGLLSEQTASENLPNRIWEKTNINFPFGQPPVD